MSFFLMLAALFLSSFCIRAPAAAVSPPSYPPATACSFASSPSCPLVPPTSSSASNVTTLPDTSPPRVFSNISSLCLSTNLSSFSTLTLNFTDELLDCTPSLVFALTTQSSPLIIDVVLLLTFPDPLIGWKLSSLPVCKSQQPQSQTPTNSSCTPSHSESEESDYINYAVSLTYDADSATVQMRLLVSYEGELALNETLIVNTTVLQAYANDSIVLFVDYVPSGTATINISTRNDTSSSLAHKPILSDSSSPAHEPVLSDQPPSHKSNSKSKHISVVVWVVVGVSILALLVGITILALFIKKQYYRHPPLISSHLTGQHDTIPSSTTLGAPFRHHRLESQSSVTPMMGASPLSPPYNIENFQLSNSASWVKQPNPR